GEQRQLCDPRRAIRRADRAVGRGREGEGASRGREARDCDPVRHGLYDPTTGLSTNGETTNEITCLIVDDHEVVREGLRLSLSRAPHIRVIGEAGDGESAVALAERRRPNVVIMDVRMPGMDGLEATKLLTEKVPDSPALIFTAYSE